jgi:hypothetical protein
VLQSAFRFSCAASRLISSDPSSKECDPAHNAVSAVSSASIAKDSGSDGFSPPTVSIRGDAGIASASSTDLKRARPPPPRFDASECATRKPLVGCSRQERSMFALPVPSRFTSSNGL